MRKHAGEKYGSYSAGVESLVGGSSRKPGAVPKGYKPPKGPSPVNGHAQGDQTRDGGSPGVSMNSEGKIMEFESPGWGGIQKACEARPWDRAKKPGNGQEASGSEAYGEVEAEGAPSKGEQVLWAKPEKRAGLKGQRPGGHSPLGKTPGVEARRVRALGVHVPGTVSSFWESLRVT